jgi:hypothetical protein
MKEMILPQGTESYSYRFSVIDENGRIVIDAGRYLAVGSFSEGLAPVQLANKGWGYIDPKGSLIIRPQFDTAIGFSEGLAGVQIEGLWGFIDKKGRIVIQPQYEFVNSFSEGIAVVVKGAPGQTPDPTTQGEKVQGESLRKEIVTLASRPDRDRNADLQCESKEVLLIDKTGQSVFCSRMNEIQLSIYGMPDFLRV